MLGGNGLKFCVHVFKLLFVPLVELLIRNPQVFEQIVAFVTVVFKRIIGGFVAHVKPFKKVNSNPIRILSAFYSVVNSYSSSL